MRPTESLNNAPMPYLFTTDYSPFTIFFMEAPPAKGKEKTQPKAQGRACRSTTQGSEGAQLRLSVRNPRDQGPFCTAIVLVKGALDCA
ncbi:hypothetical protein [Desulfoluna spongiiphila]|uniref:hypothetical protein n=1 Tax=Desulfoluna spongiiphila TaxID=419481 RepID=UPI00125F9CBD|nr:hypothetical protein [Desulfoluna spongiiphila]